MPSSKAQLQQDNARLTAQCETLETELASLQQRYQALSCSEARYRQAVENSPISISFLSADGQHVEANAAFERMMGFTVEDSQRVGFNLFTDPALEANGTRPYILRALAGETVIEPPINFYDASQLYGKEAVKQYTPGQGHYFPIWNEDGEVQEIVEMAPEVTDLLQAQAEAQAERDHAAQERANLLSTVAQVANLLLRSQDYTTVFPDVVRLLGEAVGSDRCAITQELPASVGHPHRVRLLTEWHRESVASVLTGSPEFGQGVEINIPPSFHQPLLQGDAINLIISEVAEPDWRAFFEAHDNVSMLIVPVMLADGCWGHIGFDNCQDASLFDEVEIAILQVAAESIAAAIERQQKDEALRASEKRYRTLFELSSEGIYRFQLEPPLSLALSPQDRLTLGYQVNQIVEVNQAFAEQYGFDAPEDLVGTKIGDFYDHEHSQVNDGVNVALMRDLRVSKIETVETDRLGHRHWFLSSVVCDVRDDAIVGGWGVQTDVTELKQAQQSLLEAEQTRAQELERFNAELQQALELLQTRDRILNATAESVTSLLTDSEFERAIDQALEILGTSVECDRVEIFQHFADDREQSLGVLRLQFEWYSAHATPQQAHPTLTEITQDGLEALWLRLRAGECLTGAIESYPEPFRSGQIELGVQSTHSVPIFVEGHYWGIVAIDHCREQRQLTPVELSVFKTAATCIGSAIERDRTEKAILQAEQERARELERFNAELQQALELLQARDRILEATADAANALLSTDNLNDAVDTALHIIGESLDTDRVNIIEVEPFDQNSNLSQVSWQILNEWNSASTVSQRLHPIHQQGDHTGIEEWLTLFSSGQSASFLLEELPEPFRSGQAEIGVKAYHAVPIFLEGTYWGNLGIDDCREAKHRDPAELAVLKTVAACIGSAIERERLRLAELRTQQAILQTEQARTQELQSLNIELQVRLNDIQNRDFIAETAATVSNVLLREESLQSAINRALQILGKALNLDRVAVIEIDSSWPELASRTWQVLYEWDASNIPSQMADVELAQGTFAGIETLYEKMSQGQVLSYLLEELPEPFHRGQAALGVKALHEVPIFVAGQFWGAIGFDNCHESKRLSQTELSMLKITADCIGSAIQRERLRLAELRTQQALLRAQRDRVAELAKTNLALKNSLDRLAATPDLDAFLGYVLTEIAQQFDGKTASLHLFNP
ncbi:MAG: GAF domain-containing protein, partial [Leptolyngbya sp. SIO1D8]|nr:GAF domain-containing protein [Leptolyngbya sp. SIO1D8]